MYIPGTPSVDLEYVTMFFGIIVHNVHAYSVAHFFEHLKGQSVLDTKF